jgi:regulatory protein
MKTITKIEPQKKRKNRVSIFLDGIFFCGVPEPLIVKLDLFQGKRVDEEEIAHLITRKLIEEAKQKIIRLLNRRMYSAQEVTDKLKKKGYEDVIVSAVVNELRDIALIDDRAFAKAFVYDRLHLNPQGSFKIAHELKKRGVPEYIIEQTLAEEQVAETDLKRASEIASKRAQSLSGIKDPQVRKRRLYNYLLRRGFSYTVIYQVLHEVLKKELDRKGN